MDSFLLKAFKYFDLTNNGYLSKRDFFKAVAKCGVVVQPNVTVALVRILIWCSDTTRRKRASSTIIILSSRLPIEKMRLSLIIAGSSSRRRVELNRRRKVYRAVECRRRNIARKTQGRLKYSLNCRTTTRCCCTSRPPSKSKEWEVSSPWQSN